MAIGKIPGKTGSTNFDDVGKPGKPGGGTTSSSGGGSSSSAGGGGGSSTAGGFTNSYQKGSNSTLDSALKPYQDQYKAARDKGDAAGMRAANDAANQLRNQYGYAAEYADKDIGMISQMNPGYAGGGYTGTGSYGGGTSGDGSSGDNLYQQYLEESQRQYAEMQAQQEAAKKAAVEQAVGQLAGQKTGVEQSYADLYRQLYLDRRMAEKSLPQQMAAMGYNGGLTESSALGLATNYSDALRQGEQAKQGTLSEIDRAITDTRLTGDISMADQAAQLARDKLATYGDIVSGMQNQQNWQQQFGYQQSQDTLSEGWRNKQWDYSVGQDEYGRKKESALTLAGVGNFSGLADLWGLSDGDVQALTNSYAQQTQTTKDQAARALADWYAQYGDFSMLKGMGVDVTLPTKGGGGGGSGGKTTYNKAQFDIAINAMMNGDYSPGVVQIVEGYSGLPYQTVLSGSGADKIKAFSPQEFDSYLNGLGRTYYNDPEGAADILWNGYASGRLSAEQYERGTSMFRLGR